MQQQHNAHRYTTGLDRSKRKLVHNLGLHGTRAHEVQWQYGGWSYFRPCIMRCLLAVIYFEIFPNLQRSRKIIAGEIVSYFLLEKQGGFLNLSDQNCPSTLFRTLVSVQSSTLTRVPAYHIPGAYKCSLGSPGRPRRPRVVFFGLIRTQIALCDRRCDVHEVLELLRYMLRKAHTNVTSKHARERGRDRGLRFSHRRCRVERLRPSLSARAPGPPGLTRRERDNR